MLGKKIFLLPPGTRYLHPEINISNHCRFDIYMNLYMQVQELYPSWRYGAAFIKEFRLAIAVLACSHFILPGVSAAIYLSQKSRQMF